MLMTVRSYLPWMHFFDLLKRVEAGAKDKDAVRSILSEVQQLPYGCWRSMERSFYTLHMRGT